MTSELLNLIGSNFHSSKKVDVSLIDKALSRMDNFVYKKGYNLQQMFEITKEMDTFLKTYPVLWNSYGMMLKRIDTLVKNNLMYDSYTRIYPSPEMQLNWFYPKKKTAL